MTNTSSYRVIHHYWNLLVVDTRLNCALLRGILWFECPGTLTRGTLTSGLLFQGSPVRRPYKVEQMNVFDEREETEVVTIRWERPYELNRDHVS